MRTKKSLLIILSLLLSLTVSAQKGDEIWKSITDWSEYCPQPELGDITGYYIIDVDGDGISECFTLGEFGNGFLTCSDGKGNVSKDNIVLVANSIGTTNIFIMKEKDKTFVVNTGGCGSGCHMSEYNRIINSSLTACYQAVLQYGMEGEEGDSEYMLLKPNEEPRKISETVYEKGIPQNPEVTDIEDFDWITIAKPASAGPAVSATLHYQSNDTTIIRDDKGYFYGILSSGELAVAPGGAYAGDIVIPSEVAYDGHTYKVTTIRRGAFWKKDGASNIGTITSITLPQSVTLVGADAFRDNPQLASVECGNDTRIEVRSFWGCPKLKHDRIEPTFAFTGLPGSENPSKEAQIDAFSNYYVPKYEVNDTLKRYSWVFMKYNHSGVSLKRWMNMNSEDAMACHTWNLDKVCGAHFTIRNRANVESMFKGYWNPDQEVMLADNGYVGTHEFPMFSRWIWSEEYKPAPAAYTQSMTKKYGKKIQYSYEVGKLLYTTNEQLVITEFEQTNGVAHYVMSWLKDGKEVCTFEDTSKVEPGQEYSVWNVDDDGTYGVPAILSIARDERGNIELFICHQAPESATFHHLVQKGKKLEIVNTEQWYMYIE